MTNQEINAKILVNAIKTLTQKPENLDNFENYLSAHFDVWFNKYANTPEGLIFELEQFAEMEI